MQKAINVLYTTSFDGNAIVIPLLYEREDDEAVQVIRCQVNMPFASIPAWLKPHKFEVRVLYNGNSYEALMNDTPNVHNLDAALFMEKAQAEVCLVEKRAPALSRVSRSR